MRSVLTLRTAADLEGRAAGEDSGDDDGAVCGLGDPSFDAQAQRLTTASSGGVTLRRRVSVTASSATRFELASALPPCQASPLALLLSGAAALVAVLGAVEDLWTPRPPDSTVVVDSTLDDGAVVLARAALVVAALVAVVLGARVCGVLRRGGVRAALCCAG